MIFTKNAKSNPNTENLAHLPELLLLGGGGPLYFKDHLIGAIGVFGGGGPENDDIIARAAKISKFDIVAQ